MKSNNVSFTKLYYIIENSLIWGVEILMGKFKKSYSRYDLKVELSIGDFDVDDAKLEKADIIVTTYEKMDSLLRNFYDKEWIYEISIIIIDEIHIIGESDRGPRLESLIV